MIDSPRNSNALSSAEIDENNEAGTFNQIEDALRETLGTIISEQATDSDGCEYMFSKLIFRKGAELAVAEVRKNHHGTTGFEEEGYKFVVKVDAFFVSAKEQDEVGVDPDGFILDEYMLEAEEQVREDDIKELMKFSAETDPPQINPPVGIAFNDALEAFAKAADAYAGRNLGICAVQFAEWIGICMDADRVQICYGQLEWEGKRCAVALMSEYDVFLPDPDNATPEPAAALR